jgi:dephospho-CoA kinase
MLIGLTGNIGSGKSLVAMVFTRLGIPVYNADEHAKDLYKFPDVIHTLKTTFGRKILDSSGSPDLKALAEVVFSDRDKLSALNAILHPLVIDQIKQWYKAQTACPYAIVESAIIYEHGLESLFDLMIVVSAPENLRLQRVIARDGASIDHVQKRTNNQWQEKEKTDRADYIIVNDQNQSVIEQVLKIHSNITIGGKSV